MVDTTAMMEEFNELQAGDLLLLHGCCHNPTGANLDMAAWRAITDLVIEKGVIPFVDIAYQGFGDGPDEMRQRFVIWPQKCLKCVSRRLV